MKRLLGRLVLSAFALGLFTSSPGRAADLEKTTSELTRASDYEEVGDCLMRSKRKLMLSFVLSEELAGTNFISLCLETPEFRRIMGEGIDTSRLGGAVAAAFMRSTHAARFDPLIGHAPQLDHGEIMTVDQLSAQGSVSRSQKIAFVHNANWQRSNRILAECAIRANPVLSRELIVSKIGSHEEVALLTPFAAILSECARSSVSHARLHAIRQVVALPYMQLAVKAYPPLRAELD